MTFRTLAVLAFLLIHFAASPVFAQDKDNAAKDDKPPVDWVDVESTGILSQGLQGGVDKTIWKDQPRSDIEFLLSRLPGEQPVRALLSLQRRLLLSKTDTSQITNDIGPLRGGDLLIQRINKLMEMGLYDDAWELYAQKAAAPYDVSYAQLGILLMITRGDMATACLEEKVLSARYPKDGFFDLLDRACAHTMGSGTPAFPDNAVFQSVFHDGDYSVPAADPDILTKMTPLERAVVLANGRIRYDGLSRAILAKTPPALVTLYVMDPNLPDDAAALIERDIESRGLKYYVDAAAKDETLRKARDIKNPQARWSLLESALTRSVTSPADLAPFANMIAVAEPTDLSTDLITKALAVLLATREELPSHWIDAAQQAAPKKPIIYIYLQAFESLTPTKISSLEPSQVVKGMKRLKPEDRDQVIAIIDTLDEDSQYSKDLLSAYEKHLGLTGSGNYVMPSLGLNILLETAPTQKQTGITVLAVLNSLAAKPDNIYSGSVRKALYSMLNVGLIEDARMTGSEMVASVLNKY